MTCMMASTTPPLLAPLPALVVAPAAVVGAVPELEEGPTKPEVGPLRKNVSRNVAALDPGDTLAAIDVEPGPASEEPPPTMPALPDTGVAAVPAAATAPPQKECTPSLPAPPLTDARMSRAPGISQCQG